MPVIILSYRSKITTIPSSINANTLLLVNNGTTSDRSPYHNANTVTGTVTIASSPKRFTYSSYYFGATGTNSYAFNSSNFSFGTGNFSTDIWVYRADNMGSAGIISSGQSYYGLGGILLLTTNTTVLMGVGSGSSLEIAANNVPIDLNTWTHLAITRYNGTLRAFKNGALQGSVASIKNLTNTKLIIGSRFTDLGGILRNTYLSNIRVSTDNIWTSNFTPPTADYN